MHAFRRKTQDTDSQAGGSCRCVAGGNPSCHAAAKNANEQRVNYGTEFATVPIEKV